MASTTNTNTFTIITMTTKAIVVRQKNRHLQRSKRRQQHRQSQAIRAAVAKLPAKPDTQPPTEVTIQPQKRQPIAMKFLPLVARDVNRYRWLRKWPKNVCRQIHVSHRAAQSHPPFKLSAALKRQPKRLA